LSKARQKRLQKELRNLLSAGRYWEWLEAVETNGQVQEFKAEWRDAWQTLARRAFRDPQKLEEFQHRSEGLKDKSDLPDVRFLLNLTQFIDEENRPEALAPIPGMSLPAELIRKRALAWKREDFPRQRLQVSLEALIQYPQKVTKKTYEALAAQLRATSFAPPIIQLGGTLSVLSPLGRAAGRTQRWRCERIESAVKIASDKLPPSLFEILVFPFLHRLNGIVQRWLQSPGKERALGEAVSSMPLLFSMLRGEKREQGNQKSIDSQATDLKHVREIAASTDLDAKIVLLAKLRSAEKKEIRKPLPYEAVTTLYKGILFDLRVMRSGLAQAEKENLSRVIESVLMRDLQFLWNELPESENDFIGILMMAAEAGCLGRRMAALSLVLAERRGNRDLRQAAQALLAAQGKPSREDVLWVMGLFVERIFPRVTALRSLLRLWDPEDPMIEEIGRAIWSEAIRDLAYATSLKIAPFPFLLPGEDASREMRRDLQTLRSELSSTMEWKPFERMAQFLHCFPENAITDKGLVSYLEKVYEANRSLLPIIEMMEGLTPPPEMFNPLLDDFAPPRSSEGDFSGLERIFRDFLLDHWEEMKVIELNVVGRLVEALLRKGEKPRDASLLVRLSNLLEERFRKGEKEAADLQRRVMDCLLRIRRRRRKPVTEAGPKRRRLGAGTEGEDE